MGKNSNIEWTKHTFNPWWGCTKVSPGCDHCYADTLSSRWGYKIWGPDAERRFFGDKHWSEPEKWNREAEAAGERARVFCGSMCDWAEGRHDQQEARDKLFDLIEATPHLDWLLLTKRPGAIPYLIPPAWLESPRPNVWFGTSVENQEQADRRIPQLLQVPATVRFLSCEPLLGELDLSPWMVFEGQYGKAEWCLAHYGHSQPLHWIIAGGESGHGARPMHPDWVRGLRDQAVAAGVAFFHKQWGEYEPYEHDAQPPFFQDQHGRLHDGHGLDILDPETGDIGKGWHEDSLYSSVAFRRIGKKAAGRLLDGQEWNQFPEVEVPV